LKVYEDFVEALDGIDNGIAQYEATVAQVTTRALYKSKTDLSSRVAKVRLLDQRPARLSGAQLNPAWNEASTDDVLDSQFLKASALAGSEFFENLDYTFKAWLPARDIVQKALQNRPAEFSDRVVVFDQFAPWKDHLFKLEAALGMTPALYVLYPEDGSSKWRIQAVPETADSFKSRKALPEPWRGLRDDELSAKTGVEGWCVSVRLLLDVLTWPGSIFVHAAGFIGGMRARLCLLLADLLSPRVPLQGKRAEAGRVSAEILTCFRAGFGGAAPSLASVGLHGRPCMQGGTGQPVLLRISGPLTFRRPCELAARASERR
jgi:urease accessory protein